MYWNKLKFDGQSNFKEFKATFSDGNNLNGVIFKKEKDYFITSLSAHINIHKEIKELEDFKEIQEVSEIANSIKEKGNSHLQEEIFLEFNLKNIQELSSNKKKRKFAVKSLEFYNTKTKKKEKVSIYSQFKELEIFGLKFEKENGIVYKYTINLIEDTKRNLFLEKKIFFDKKKIIEEIKKEYDYKNTFFIKHNGKLKAYKIEFVEFLEKHIDNRLNFDFMRLIKNSTSEFKFYFLSVIFGDSLLPKRRPKHIFTKGDYSAITDLHPIAINKKQIAIKGGVDFYITPELYEKKHSIFKKVPEIPAINVTQNELSDLRKELNDDNFTVTKLYGFRNIKAYSLYPILSIDDFVIPNFNVKVTIKKQKKEINANIKKIFQGSFYILDNSTNTSKKTEIISKNIRSVEIKNKSPEQIERDLNGQYFQLKKSIEKINLKSINHVYENFFLYDLENIIKPSFTTELQKEFSIYGLVNFSSEIDKKNKKIKVISPNNNLKFKVEKDIYKNQLKFELSKVHSKKTFDIVNNNIYNFGILSIDKKIKIGEKRAMSKEIIDSVTIIGIQNTEYSYINPIHIQVKSESVIRKLLTNKTNKYRFSLKSLIFSSNITNDTDVIFLISDGLNNAKQVFINKKIESVVGIIYLSEIKNWDIIKGQSIRTQAVFSNPEDLKIQTSHFTFSFVTKNLSDILKFSLTLVDGENKLIKFKEGEDKIPIVTFDIEIF